MTDYVMTIDGVAVPGTTGFEVVDPATGAPFAEAPDCSAEQLDAAVAAAAGAFSSWSADAGARRSALLAAADALEAASASITPVITAEQGKPLADAAREVPAGCIWLRHFATYEDPPEVLQDDDQALVRIVRKPHGVVAGIIPWNFPVIMALQTIGPALAAGNTMVVKPSPYTPLSTLLVGQVMAEHLPPGVLNVVSGSDPLGASLTTHPDIRKIHFTGSIETGKKVAAAVAPDLKRVTLELGGNDPAILLEDVDVEQVAQRLFWSAFTNNGQICIAVKRVYAPRHRYDDVVEALAEIAKGVPVGEGTAPETRLGPINNRPQHERVAGLVADALSRGAVAAAGGAPIDRPGYFFEPTVLANVEDGVAIVDEEQFGPALPVVPYDDVEDALRAANATRYGLGGSVWGADVDRAEAVAARLESGAAWVNTHMGTRPNLPLGGVKWSGIGVSWGRDGYRSLTEAQLLYRSRAS